VIAVGCKVRVPVDPNGRVATVTEEASQGGRWRIDWHEPLTGQHRWAWWDTDSLQVVR
jgi:hypothetical protein